MTKKGINLEDMVDSTIKPKNTGVPQRGVRPRKEKVERRSDQMSIRMKPSTRESIEILADQEGVPIAELVERAIIAYSKSAR